MKKIMPFIFILLVIIVSYFMLSKEGKEPKKLIFKSAFGKQGTALGEFDRPVCLAIKENYLYLADTGNSRIQILKINPDGSLIAESVFGKEGKGLGEFEHPSNLSIKDNYLFVADSGNSRIQVLSINPEGHLSPKFAFGKEGKGLGRFGGFPAPFKSPAPLDLTTKDNYLFVADSGNSRIQVLSINPEGHLSPKFAFGKEGKGLGEFMYPFGLVEKDNSLYVSDTGNSRIQVLEIR